MANVRYGDVLQRLAWSAEHQRRYRESRLRSLLSHATKKVPFYQRRFHQHGIGDREIRNLKDIALLPPTSRLDFEGDSRAFLTEGVSRRECEARASAKAAEGQQRVHLSQNESDLLKAVERRVLESNGLEGRYSSLAAVPPAEIPAKQSWRERLFKGRRDYISNAETVTEQLRVLKELKPDCFSAPLWVLTRLASEIRKGATLGFKPRLLVTFGDPLREADRESLREAFGVAPTDIYQTWEFGPIAAECPQHGGLHVNFDLVYIEILHGDRAVEDSAPGEVVITSLAYRTMPLIRYRLGDLASWKGGPCECGWSGPVLEAIHGRLENSIVLPGGDFVTPRQVEKCLDQFTNVQEYRVIQTESRKLEILVVPATLFQEKTAELVRRECIELCRGQLGVELKTVDQLPILSGRRRHHVVCKVPH